MRAALRLFRVANTPSAVADVLSGIVVAGGSIASVDAWLSASASLFLYGAGVARNDIEDCVKDASLHPDRPLPSGALSERRARLLVLAAELVGVVLAAVSVRSSAVYGAPWIAAAAAVLVVLLAVSYNAVHDRRPLLGAALMAATRMANFLRGVVFAFLWTAGKGMDLAPIAVALSAHGVLIFAVTRISQLEGVPSPATLPKRRLLFVLTAPVAILVLAVTVKDPVTAMGLAATASAWSAWAMRPATFTPPVAGACVGRAIGTWTLWNALSVAAAGTFLQAVAVAVLFPVAKILRLVTAQRGA